ncbi:hypothetical protein ACYX7E_10145 [Luteimonas sp. RIT-PG2_3]
MTDQMTDARPVSVEHELKVQSALLRTPEFMEQFDAAKFANQLDRIAARLRTLSEPSQMHAHLLDMLGVATHEEAGAEIGRLHRLTLSEPARWLNGCDKTVPEALRFLARNDRPTGGEQRFNFEHLMQLAAEIEKMAGRRPPALSEQPDIQAAQDAAIARVGAELASEQQQKSVALGDDSAFDLAMREYELEAIRHGKDSDNAIAVDAAGKRLYDLYNGRHQPAAGDDARVVAWIRYRSDGGVEGPILDSVIEDVRRKSGVWEPLVHPALTAADHSEDARGLVAAPAPESGGDSEQ